MPDLGTKTIAARDTADFLVIGGGIVGLTMALEAKRRHPGSRVTLIEKEKRCGLHASGRNSGVLHAGFYYTADSLKARFTREGNRRLTEYCMERGLRINRCGKLVVARHEAELAGLDELLKRGRHNGVVIHEVTEQEARGIEPRVKTYTKALFSPTTSSIDPGQVMASLGEDARAAGIRLLNETSYVGRSLGGVRTSHGNIAAGYIINAAGLYADRVARDFGFCRDYRILPFKGLYLYSSEPPGSLKTHIYPVPDLKHPFLGVHYTITADGKSKVGPTAIPAFWRENYKGLSRFRADEALEVVLRQLGMFLRNDFRFRSLAVMELRKYFRARMVHLASELLAGVVAADYRKWGPPGIRAQLVHVKERRLEMDFRYEGDHRSFHILNAVSPAFTCSLPFAEFLFDRIEEGRLAA